MTPNTLSNYFKDIRPDDPKFIPVDHVDKDSRLIKYPKVDTRFGWTHASKLDASQKIKARNLAMQAAWLGLTHRHLMHYSQGSRRWNGIRFHMRASQGKFPHYLDCSAFVEWCIWCGLSHFKIKDLVSGLRWHSSYTVPMMHHGLPVHEGHLIRADVVFYGRNGYPEHAAIYVGGGKVISQGSEGGPYFLPVHYRSDVLAFRRYI